MGPQLCLALLVTSRAGYLAARTTSLATPKHHVPSQPSSLTGDHGDAHGALHHVARHAVQQEVAVDVGTADGGNKWRGGRRGSGRKWASGQASSVCGKLAGWHSPLCRVHVYNTCICNLPLNSPVADVQVLGQRDVLLRLHDGAALTHALAARARRRRGLCLLQ